MNNLLCVLVSQKYIKKISDSDERVDLSGDELEPQSDTDSFKGSNDSSSFSTNTFEANISKKSPFFFLSFFNNFFL